MKKIFISAAFIFIFCGWAAAQKSSAKQATTQEKKATAKKGAPQKSTGDKIILKQESARNAKSDSVKLKFPVPKHTDSLLLPADTTAYPMTKHRKK